MYRIIKHNSILPLLLLLLSLGVSRPVVAQKTTASLRQQELRLLWLQQGKNAAALQLEQPLAYTLLSANYGEHSGNFHKAMEAERRRNILLSAEGGLELGGFQMWGSFKYSGDRLDNAGYNASLIAPYRRMPYFVVDENLSDWRNQHYDLSFKVATPQLGRFITLGLSGSYQTENGAKQRDIRTLNRTLNIHLEPSLLITFSPKYHLGLTFLYASHKEESRMHNVNVYIDQPHYDQVGLGYGNKRIGSGRTTDYVGTSLGGGLQLGFTGVAFKGLLSGGYTLRVEDAHIGFSQPRDEGTTRANSWDVALRLSSNGTRDSHHFTTEYRQHRNDGIQYITYFDNTEEFRGYLTLQSNVRAKYVDQQLQMSYTWMRSERSEYLWTLGVKGALNKHTAEYLIPHSYTERQVLQLALEGDRNWILSPTSARRLELSGMLGYERALSEKAHFDEVSTNTFLVEKIEQHDHHYHTSPRVRAQLGLTYFHPVGKSGDNQVFLKLACGYDRALKSELFKHRLFWGLSLGYFF